jgi:hypothetical protein
MPSWRAKAKIFFLCYLITACKFFESFFYFFIRRPSEKAMVESFSVALIQCTIKTAIYKHSRKTGDILLLLGFFPSCSLVIFNGARW